MMDTLNYDEMSMERDCPENLSIGLETLIKILDEEPAPPIPDLLGTSAGPHMEQLDCQRDCEPLHPQHESRPSEFGNLNSLDDSEHNEPWFEPSAEHKGISNHYGIFCGDPLHTPHLVESNDLCSSPSVHSSNWLRLSSTDLDISVIDSCGDSFGSFVTDDVNINKPQNNSPNCGFSQGCTDEFGLFYKRQFNFTSDAYLVGLKDNLENQNFEAPLQHSSRKSNTDLDNISSPCLLQMGERSLAHIMLTEECGSINKRHSDLNGDAILGSPVQSENTHTNFVACKSEDLALPPQYKISPDINSTERIKDSHDANNSYLTATGDFLVSSVAGLEPCLSVKVRDLPHDEMAQFHGKNGEGTRLFLFNDSVKCTVQSGSTVDMDLALPQQYKISPDINSTERIKDAHDANNSFLSISEDFLVSADAASRPSLPAKVMGIPHYNVTQFPENNGGGTRLLLSKDSVNCTVQEQSTHSSVLEDSVDMDALLTCSLYAQQYRCEDTGMMSESSTDSSPLPYNHKPMLLNLNGSANNLTQLISDHKMVLQRKEQKDLINEKKRPQISTTHQQQHQHSKIAKIAIESKPSRRNSTLDDDTDLFILDDFNDSILPAPPPALVNPHHHAGPGTLRTRSDDERLTFRLALQDLSQPKVEASPPDGVLAVPLLRHQRIALSWMVQKETAGLNCSGGILADDQGLGKTVSTIALILTERFQPSASCSVAQKKLKFEPLNLDDEDDGGGSVVFYGNKMMQLSDSGPSINIKPIKSDDSLVPKGRPAAGTLVVCPTSVLRQWAEELKNKITREANLSFLVYHGSNRTKDPYELAKFDVVLTTYSIVSMEVSKHPLVDKDDMERGKHVGCSMFAGNSASNKRKESSNASLKTPKKKTVSGNAELESACPLAKVGWFRVILDEAQTIKNHRTQVARACWGLRAKRRWCLSGTPIQNAIDDLYSYFRFLRYDPYAVYKSFCSTIKFPISRNPTNGYKKLQAVLKTVMLRRTKGTLIDGKPVITLPPKTVNLKKVDFSDEEHEFYLALEAESREQFKVYADAGTVKQNYVNILLMLLRLRQACDHPLLVNGHDSNSVWKSSLNTAMKLPKDKLVNLLSCLEASLAICTICNDPPEDAVVSICGHVFCNQCICEHLTGDDNICPSAVCREKLNSGSVFSMDTLRRCLFEQPGLDFFPEDSISVQRRPKICRESLCSGSSKIRAALEILRSLPLSKASPSLCKSAKPYNESSNFLEDAVNTISVGCSSNNSAGQQSIHETSNVKQTEKAIVFSQWTRMLDLLEVSLKDSHILYRRLDGTMSVAAREKAVKDFNMLPEVTVIIMSLKAASLGLNMVAACHVILLDLWWNPTTEDQAIDRAHRIGQTRPVTVFRLTVRNTVEDRILALQETSYQYLFPKLLSSSAFYHRLKKAESVIAIILILFQSSFTLPSSTWDTWFISSANAVLYSPDTKVPRTGELALRRAIPANANMKAIQNSLEDISYLLRIPQRKPYGTMEGDVKNALKIAMEQKESILGTLPEELMEKGSMLFASLTDGKGGLKNLIEFIKENDPDKISVVLQSSLDTLAELELLQAPGLPFLLPEQYVKYPRLTGRSVVNLVIEKSDGSTFFPSAGGEPKKFATIQVVLDGYSAPLTAGNFAKLVTDGAYDGVKLKCTNQAVLSDNELDNYGYSVPLEIKPSGEFEPLYKTALSIQDGELPVLPLSVYGAVAMAHNADSEYSSPSQFFFYLYDKRNAGLGGLSFEEGQFSVFGYTTDGRDVLSQIKTGDLIRSAKLVQGQDRLILPEQT